MDAREVYPVLFERRGQVLHGDGRGQALGFPTANIPIGPEAPYLSGIYAGLVLRQEAEYRAAVYIDEKRQLLEAHLFDFEGDLYDEEITVRLLAKVSEHAAFQDMEQLQKKIADDVQKVIHYFQS